MSEQKLYVGIDVGSTTVKMVVVDAISDQIVWQDYQRHEARQAEKVLDFLIRIEKKFTDVSPNQMKVFITGSGGKNISRFIGAKFVQEVNAVALATEKLYPEIGSVIELGGQDSKIIIFKESSGGIKKKMPSMNDKCAGGTGAVIDKINAKLHIPSDELCKQAYDGIKLHHVAGKCGVFAETDINSLQKQGIPRHELMASLFDAIILQNLTILTRGNTLRPLVLLLGGPNTFILGLQQAWRYHICKMWKERNVELPKNYKPEDLIIVPDNALYFAALGTIEYGKEEPEHIGVYLGWQELEKYIRFDREKEKAGAVEGLVNSSQDMQSFLEKYSPPIFLPAVFQPGQIVQGFIGLDGGSTSTKAVLMSPEKEVLIKAYNLSKGNPIEDAKAVIQKLNNQVEIQGAKLEVLGLATTGYSKDVLKDAFGGDASIVETVAHTSAALHYYKDVDVICDVGGQDIKIMMLKEGKVKDFKLNTQCSAGNGYFLQSTAEDFNIPVHKYAENAFQAKVAPEFGYGCAVFLQSDIVNFQRQGWQPKEILAGLARVLPKNIWLYVAEISNFSKLGTKFLLQGGTQRNLAAVKAQVDFIKSRFHGKKEQPNIIVHIHCGESGAIGAALESIKLWKSNKKTAFIGLDKCKGIKYDTITKEDTRCLFCKNKCLRTFIDINTEVADHENTVFCQLEEEHAKLNGKITKQLSNDTNKKGIVKVPQAANTRRIIVGHSCEKGSVEDVTDMRLIKKKMDATIDSTPNMADISFSEVFKSYAPEKVMGNIPKFHFTSNSKNRAGLMKMRSKLRIGIPSVLIMVSHAPVFSAYFESLGIRKSNIVFSDFTSDELYRTGSKRGSVDPCFPSKLSIAHVHNLLYKHHEKRALDIVFFPMVSDLPKSLNTVGFWTCPTVAGMPEVVKAAFTKEEDIFASLNLCFLDTFINLSKPAVFERQMYEQFKDILGLSKKENKLAVKEGYKALEQYNTAGRKKGRELLDRLVKSQKLGIVVLGRPYHNDPGINHGIFKEFQNLNYPILTQDTLPMDDDILDDIFGKDMKDEIISDAFDISDVWKNSLNSNSNMKIWAAKFIARHPNLVALEISSFKCGHDAPTYNVVEQIIEQSGTPYFSFKDIDENKSTGSIKLRVETIDYFLKQYWALKTLGMQRDFQ
ncbi:MAG: activator of 2-hydroxyglutaryl-CoA dehydratase/predicted nucleotide-binding protein (sugar kinase) [Ulvibacter sp.]|jgi:activator of 2-hydroxyglutaryl-CoA dehydratase/predicted nucleotide-binding protein (sugar kinase/HSP70/actin superfamily)